MKTLLPELNDLLELRHQAHTLGLASHHPVNSVLCGLYQSVFKGQGMEFDEVREYREGDEIRNMDWRVTARTGIPHLKVFREERQRTVMLCVDVGQHMAFGTRGTFKSVQAARAAALLGWAASSNQDRVGAILYGHPDGLQFFRPSSSRRALWQTLKTMSELKSARQSQTNAIVDTMQKLVHGTPTGALILIVGDFNEDLDHFEQVLGRLKQHHEIVIFPVDDPADKELPAMGRVVFTSAEGKKIDLDTNNVTGRQQFRAVWEKNRERLELSCKRLGVDVITLPTNEDVHQVLASGLRKRSMVQSRR